MLNRIYKNSKIVDPRTSTHSLINNNILLTCEHATNKLPPPIQWSPNDTLNFANTHWAVDIGALQMANTLAKDYQCLLIHSLYSRLYCDVNRPIISDTLFRKDGDGMQVELNQSIHDEQQRLDCYDSYYRSFREIFNNLPQISTILSIHSFTPLYEGQKRELEIGILYNHDHCQSLAEQYAAQFLKDGFNCKINEPYSGKLGLTQAVDQIVQSDMTRKGILLEFRNDLLQSQPYFQKIRQSMNSI